MTLKEFTDRTGLTPTAQEFDFVNELYMECPTLDKDEFCHEFKKHGMSRIIPQLMDSICGYKTGRDNVFNDLMAIEKKKFELEQEMATFLLGKAEVLNDPDLEEKALELVPRSTAILIKIKHNYSLSNEDMMYIATNLK